jgi:hypothetical protein
MLARPLLSFRSLLGGALLGCSAIAVLQTMREMHISEQYTSYAQIEHSSRALRIAGRYIELSDEFPYQPTEPARTEDRRPGVVTFRIDGRVVGSPARLELRTGRNDLGRYHGWVHLLSFRDLRTGEESLWIARRLQPSASDVARFELSVLSRDGTVDTQVLSGWQLSTEYRRHRATQLLTESEWTAFPLSVVPFLHFPPLLLVFPLGSASCGAWLLRRRKPALATR